MHTTYYTYKRNHVVLDVNKLIDSTKNKQPIYIDANNVKKISRTEKSGFSEKRLAAADISYPIIIDSKYEILDGRHRLLKAMDNGIRRIPAIIADDNDIKKSIKILDQE